MTVKLERVKPADAGADDADGPVDEDAAGDDDDVNDVHVHGGWKYEPVNDVVAAGRPVGLGHRLIELTWLELKLIWAGQLSGQHAQREDALAPGLGGWFGSRWR